MKKLVIAVLLSVCMVSSVFAMESAGKIEVKKIIQAGSSWDGNVLPAYPQGKPEITILRIKIPAGASLAAHYHPVINAGVLLSGELTVIALDGQMNKLQAGDALIELVNTAHYGKNTGDSEAEIIVFYAGEEGKAITVKND